MSNEPEVTPVYVVLGATGGIGSELCRRLIADGARLVIGARGREKLDSLADELDAQSRKLDATRPDEVGDVASTISWLLDAHQSWVTGQVFGVDGGISSVRTLPRQQLRR